MRKPFWVFVLLALIFVIAIDVSHDVSAATGGGPSELNPGGGPGTGTVGGGSGGLAFMQKTKQP